MSSGAEGTEQHWLQQLHKDVAWLGASSLMTRVPTHHAALSTQNSEGPASLEHICTPTQSGSVQPNHGNTSEVALADVCESHVLMTEPCQGLVHHLPLVMVQWLRLIPCGTSTSPLASAQGSVSAQSNCSAEDCRP